MCHCVYVTCCRQRMSNDDLTSWVIRLFLGKLIQEFSQSTVYAKSNQSGEFKQCSRYDGVAGGCDWVAARDATSILPCFVSFPKSSLKLCNFNKSSAFIALFWEVRESIISCMLIIGSYSWSPVATSYIGLSITLRYCACQKIYRYSCD